MSEDLQIRCKDKIINAVEKYLTEAADANLDVNKTFIVDSLKDDKRGHGKRKRSNLDMYHW